MNPIITSSEIDCFLTCQRKHYLRYVKQIVSTRKEPSMDFGSAVHAGLEEYFKAFLMRADGNHDTAKRMAADAIREKSEELGLEPFDEEKAVSMVNAYCDYWRYNDDDPLRDFEVLDVEVTLFVPMNLHTRKGSSINACSLSGKLDALLRHKESGKLYILDHKTASSPSPEYFEKVAFDNQMTFYAIMLEYLHQEEWFRLKYNLPEPTFDGGYKSIVGGVIYDVLSKPSIRLKKAESNEDFLSRYEQELKEGDYFTRYRLDYTSDDEEYRFDRSIDLIRILRRISKDSNVLTYPNTSACLMYSGCPYFGICKKRQRRCDIDVCEGYKTLAKHNELDLPETEV